MPELPEVQTIVSDLDKKISGDRIVEFWTDWQKAIKCPLEEFRSFIIGQRIKRVARRGKHLLFYLDNDQIMVVHLKMTGHLLVKFQIPNSESQTQGKTFFDDRVNQYIHHIWKLQGARRSGSDKTVEFSDLRKFGKIRLVSIHKLAQDDELNRLGIEPLSAEFDLSALKDILLRKVKVPIRTILLDQSLIAGIGNIYVSEILFHAGIHPQRIAWKITGSEIKKLFESIQTILAQAVKMRGTSDSDYRDTSGAPGQFQRMLNVYNREKSSCKRRGCDGIILREKIGQRSAYFCPRCQH